MRHKNKPMDNNKEQISTNLEKKEWAMPELIVIDKKVIEGGPSSTYNESLIMGAIS